MKGEGRRGQLFRSFLNSLLDVCNRGDNSFLLEGRKAVFEKVCVCVYIFFFITLARNI
jgi:hypothetical protein